MVDGIRYPRAPIEDTGVSYGLNLATYSPKIIRCKIAFKIGEIQGTAKLIEIGLSSMSKQSEVEYELKKKAIKILKLGDEIMELLKE